MKMMNKEPVTDLGLITKQKKVWDVFAPNHKSKWTWDEDLALIEKAFEHRAHWGKVLTDLHPSILCHTEDTNKLHHHFDTLLNHQVCCGTQLNFLLDPAMTDEE